MRSVRTSPRSAIPPRFTGRARSRRPLSSPRCRSGYCRTHMSPGSMPAAVRRSGTSSVRHSADHRTRRNPRRAAIRLIEGAEFVGPGSDIALGLYRYAPFYYYPGFNKPNGTGECIVSLRAWQGLDRELQAIVAHACATEASYALAEMERLNIEALAALTTQDNVKLRAFPTDLIGAARGESKDVLAQLAGKSTGAAKVHASYVAFRDKVSSWSQISTKAVLQAREG